MSTDVEIVDLDEAKRWDLDGPSACRKFRRL